MFLVVAGMLFGCIGCTTNNIESPGEEITGTGSFESMDITYPRKYKVNFMSQTTGHPSRGTDFSTDAGWKREQIHGHKLFVSTYMLHLPDKKKLQEFMLKEMKEMGI